jgi:hypothetical protein
MPKCKCGAMMKRWYLFGRYKLNVFECSQCGMTMKKVPLGDSNKKIFWMVNRFLYLFGIHKKIWWEK